MRIDANEFFTNIYRNSGVSFTSETLKNFGESVSIINHYVFGQVSCKTGNM